MSLAGGRSLLARLFDRTVLAYPWVALVLVAAGACWLGYYVPKFRFDATSDALTLSDDPDLDYYDETRQAFGSDDYVVVTVTPKGDLFSDETLAVLTEMSREFGEMGTVASVTSILNVPLLESGNVFAALSGGFQTLSTEGVDRAAAKKELLNSPLYNNFLISLDGTTTAIQITFARLEPEYYEWENALALLKRKQRAGTLSESEAAELADVDAKYRARTAQYLLDRKADMAQIRAIMDRHRNVGEMFLGGVPMVMSDIITFVEEDILYLGGGVLLFMLGMLAVIFRKIRWVFLPMLTCVLTAVMMIGFLGMRDWAATIVTSNFPPLLLVITMTMVIHIVVRYNEHFALDPGASQRELVSRAVNYVALPAFYTELTTIVGFASLLVSRITPVVDFGLIMSIALALAYVICFVFFPAILVLLPKGKPPVLRNGGVRQSPIALLAVFTERHGRLVAVGCVAAFCVFLAGAFRLKVENRFIDYFRSNTEIYQGMTAIDSRLGGTTPLEIVLEGGTPDFWLDPAQLAKLHEVHTWFDELPETGKVLSFDTVTQVLERVTGVSPVPPEIMGMLRSAAPEAMKEAVILPYMTPDYDRARITTRVYETGKTLDRGSLLKRIKTYLAEKFPEGATPAVEPHVTGVFVLYHNLIHSLFRSQILTIGTVYAAVWLMFLVLFRSPWLATIATIPNILPVTVVLGALGWSNIPLDMMTITIASITLGMAVDFAIHYIHRFQAEFPQDRDYVATMYRCHNSIGRAIWFTSITVVIGFSILTTSRFIPSVYFGIFTGLAMLMALLASLTLLPLLILWWKPLGPGAAKADAA